MKRARAWMLALAVPAALAGQDDGPGPVVRAVLFYSPSCPHCREVMVETLPPVLERYDGRIAIVIVNTATPGGQQLYRAAIESLGIPPERIGVPTLLVGTRALVGSYEIPNRLPAIADAALADASGAGTDWPPVPLIRRALAAQGLASAEREAPAPEEPEPAAPEPTIPAPAAPEPTTPEPAAPERTAPPPREPAEPEPSPGSPTPASDTALDDSLLAGAIEPGSREAMAHQLSVRERVLLDPAGNGLAIAVLILMLVTLALVAADVGGRIRIPAAPSWVIPALSALGIAVAAYLAYVEVTGAEAVCGPVGDCNTVQQSRYATILGVPVGTLGVVGFAALLAGWVVGTRGPAAVGRAAVRVTWWLALGATAFSIYLTFLEPFVIGASCAWCLSSAVTATLILAAATPARRAAARGGAGRKRPVEGPT